MAGAIKFIHASDFHLDRPIKGLADLPAHLKPVLANAPYTAAERVFDLAVSERVDFVLLAGDLFDLESGGPRAAAFLLSQFERLADKNIQVYWCAGEVDQPDRWPSSIELPDNVVTFASSVVEEVSHRRDGKTVATILGRGLDSSRRDAADFNTNISESFVIALAYGQFEPATLRAQNVRYWALGGRHKPNKLDATGAALVYPGTPQGRSPGESGPHGCRICRVDASGKSRIQSVDVDAVRWLPQKVAVSESATLDQLKNVLGERALKVATEATDQTVLVHWHVATTGEFNPLLRKSEQKEEMLDWLRDEFGRSAQGIWSTQLTIDPPKSLPSSWYEEDTILGEYLRAIGRYQSDDSLQLALHEYLPSHADSDSLSGMARVGGERREEILRQAALLGVDYLAEHKHEQENAEYVGGTAVEG